jgi:quercetin dioxygenase-like cupin family protein
MKNRWTVGLTAASLLCGTVASGQTPNVKVMLDNPSIRVELTTFDPDSGTGLHSIVTPEIGTVLEGEMTLESPLGRQTLRSGEVFWVPGLTPHDLHNTGRVPAKVSSVFLKRCD